MRLLLCHLQHPDWYVSRLQTIRYGTSAFECSVLGRGEPALLAIQLPRVPFAVVHSAPGGTPPARVSSQHNSDHPNASRTRYRCVSSRDSALEAFRHNPTDVASLHWPIDQERNHMSGPTTPLVLSRTTITTTASCKQ